MEIKCVNETALCHVTTQVTLELQPLFKRSVTFTERDDGDLEEQVAKFGYQHERGMATAGWCTASTTGCR